MVAYAYSRWCSLNHCQIPVSGSIRSGQEVDWLAAAHCHSTPTLHARSSQRREVDESINQANRILTDDWTCCYCWKPGLPFTIVERLCRFCPPPASCWLVFCGDPMASYPPSAASVCLFYNIFCSYFYSAVAWLPSKCYLALPCSILEREPLARRLAVG